MFGIVVRHTVGASLSAAGLALTAGASLGYLAYTLGGVSELEGPLLRLRRPFMGAGCAAAAVATAIAPSPLSLGALAGATGLSAYATRRQWLSPRDAPEYAPSRAGLAAGLSALLPDGRGVPLRALAHDRVALVGPWLVVHCGLARSVSVFARPRGRVRAVLPHQSGFIISVGEHLYDGVDGAPRDGGPPLVRHPVGLVRSDTVAPIDLWVPSGAVTPERAVVPRVPGARGVVDPMAFGAVIESTWRPLDLESQSPERADFLLARWAARRRGLVGA